MYKNIVCHNPNCDLEPTFGYDKLLIKTFKIPAKQSLANLRTGHLEKKGLTFKCYL
jgi:hypothetical protein